MEIRRFFVKPDDIVGNTVTISGDEYTHAVKVLRQKEGFTIIVCDGDGYDYYAEITKIEKNFLTAIINNTEINTATPKKQVVLYQGSCKLGKNDFIVQKAVELGVSKIVIFDSRYVSEKKVNTDRLGKIASEACKQCGRSDSAAVEYTDLDSALSSVDGENSIMFYENEKHAFLEDCNIGELNSVNIFVGSEGGFDDSEVALAKERGIKILSLGGRILRAETASVVAVTLVQDRIGGLK